MNHQIHSTTGESPYRVVFKQMWMQRLSFADRIAAVPENENSGLGGSDASDEECENGSESDDGPEECDSEQLNGIKI